MLPAPGVHATELALLIRPALLAVVNVDLDERIGERLLHGGGPHWMRTRGPSSRPSLLIGDTHSGIGGVGVGFEKRARSQVKTRFQVLIREV